MDEQRYHLKKLVEKLEKIRGRHTELVSFYVPAGYNLDVAKSQLASEADTASNIKSKTVRLNVIAAIEKIISELRNFKKTPENGVVVFAGNVSEVEGKPDLQVWTIIPPDPINVKLYRCDSYFVVEPLKEMLEAKHVYGLIVIDHKDANIALLKGKSIVELNNMHSFVPGKMRAGGQSAPRFQRERQEEIKQFFKKVAETAANAFRGIKNLNGILIGGPGPAKEDFYSGNFLPDDLKKKVIAVKDLSDTGQQGLRQLVLKSEDVLSQEEIIAEKKILDEFFRHLARDDGFASYGEQEVRENLEKGAVDKLLLSEALPEEKIDEFADIAKQFGTEVILISEETQEGVQLRELGGFGAILRYKTN